MSPNQIYKYIVTITHGLSEFLKAGKWEFHITQR